MTETILGLRYVADLLEAAPSCGESVMNVTVDARGILINASGGEQVARHWAHAFGGKVGPAEHVEMERPTRQVTIRPVDVDDVSIRIIEDPQRPATRGLAVVRPVVDLVQPSDRSSSTS